MNIKSSHAYAAIVVAALLLQACASIPDRPSFSIPEEARVGYLIDLNASPVHTHLGTTVFNNFTRTYEVTWNLSDHAKNALEIHLAKHGLTAVDLESFGFQASQLDGLVRLNESQWRVQPDKQQLVAELLRLHDLTAVVLLVPEGRHIVFMECGMYGCVDRWADGMGLFTRGILGLLTFHAVPAVRIDVFVLDPPVNLAAYAPVRKHMTVAGNSVPVKGMKRPDEFRDISEEELLPVKEALEAQMEVIVESIVAALMTNSGP